MYLFGTLQLSAIRTTMNVVQNDSPNASNERLILQNHKIIQMIQADKLLMKAKTGQRNEKKCEMENIVYLI